jgi:hypothetical protein
MWLNTTEGQDQFVPVQVVEKMVAPLGAVPAHQSMGTFTIVVLDTEKYSVGVAALGWRVISVLNSRSSSSYSRMCRSSASMSSPAVSPISPRSSARVVTPRHSAGTAVKFSA